MAKKLSSVIGVDIGSRKIKVAEFRTQGREPVVSAIGMVDTPEGAVDHTGIYNPEAVGAALKACLAQAGATVSQCVVSIAGQSSVLVRTLEVPRMNEAELKEHMQWEINRNIPFAESNVLSDYRPLEDEDPTSANMDVVMAISPQSAIDTVIECVKKAGKSIAAIDVQPMSIARTLKFCHDDLYAGKTVCVVDVGHKTTSINIYKGSNLLVPRQVPVGGEMFTKAISDAFGIGMEDAENLKAEKADVAHLSTNAVPDMMSGFMSPAAGGTPTMTQEFQPYNPFADDTYSAPAPEPPAAPLPTDLYNAVPGEAGGEPAGAVEPTAHEGDLQATHEQEPVHSDAGYGAAPVPIAALDPETEKIGVALSPVVEEFVTEIRRSLDYYRSKGGAVEQILLCGGGAMIRGLTSLLFQSLSTPVDIFDPLRRLNVSGKRIDPQYVDEHRLEFAVAVGNGLHVFFD